jgi:protein-serine/threonine kinase
MIDNPLPQPITPQLQKAYTALWPTTQGVLTSSRLYSANQFMNPGPAPRPPTDRPRLALTPSVSTLPGSVSGLSLQSNNNSTTSLVRAKTEHYGGAYSVIKEGNAKVKEDGGLFKSLVWNDRFMVLREFQLDFLKSQNNTKVSSSVQLRDITNVTRSEVHPSSFEITRLASSGSGASPPRDGPVKSTICKVDTDDEIYSWIDAISQRCPSMGGVSNPTNFTHRVHVGFDPVSGAFVGLPLEWERLLTASAITKEDYQKNPEAVVEVLNFYTGPLMSRAEDPLTYPSLTPTPPIEAQNRQLGYGGSGSTIAGPRPGQTVRQNTYESNPQPFSPTNEKSSYNSIQADKERQSRMEDERQRRMDDELRRKRDQDRREQERRDREDQAAYNAALPKSRPPMAKQEIGGYVDDRDPDSSNRYNPSRPAPSTPTSQRDRQQQQMNMRPNLTAQRPAPSAPGPNGQQPGYGIKPIPGKQQAPANGQRGISPGGKYAGANGAPTARAPNGMQQQQSRLPGVSAPKPLNVQSKQPTGASTQADAVKKAEQALTRKDDGGGGRKEVRMSSMTEAEVMVKLREVVSKERPLDSYNKQKKIGQGASGSVYVARIRENATSPIARRILRENGPKAQVAIKQMDLRNQPRKELIVNEIIVMKDSKHENIVNFLDAFLQEESSELWVVMEFMEGGALTDVIDNNPSISEDQIATVCFEVILNISTDNDHG